MTKKALARTVLVVAIAALLGGASLIIAKANVGAPVASPSGFFH